MFCSQSRRDPSSCSYKSFCGVCCDDDNEDDGDDAHDDIDGDDVGGGVDDKDGGDVDDFGGTSPLSNDDEDKDNGNSAV